MWLFSSTLSTIARSCLVQQLFGTTFEEAPAPLADRVFVHAQLGSDGLALDAIEQCRMTRHCSGKLLQFQVSRADDVTSIRLPELVDALSFFSFRSPQGQAFDKLRQTGRGDVVTL